MAFQDKNYFNAIQNSFPDADLNNDLKEQNDKFNCYLSNDVQHAHPAHYHEYIELIYMISSEMQVVINKNEHTLKSGDLLVIVPGDVHSFTPGPNTQYVCLQADVDFLFSQILTNTDLHYSMPYTLSKFNDARLFKASVIDNTDIPKTIYTLVNEYTSKEKFYKLAIRAGLTNIALYIFRSWDELRSNLSDENEYKNNSGLQRLAPVLDAIEERYMDDISVSDMAQIAGMSYSFFSRYFKSVMKLTFSEYLNSVRIREAEKYLIESDYSIAEIGEMVGFANTSYFISQFKKQLHITPKKYKSHYGISN